MKFHEDHEEVRLTNGTTSGVGRPAKLGERDRRTGTNEYPCASHEGHLFVPVLRSGLPPLAAANPFPWNPTILVNKLSSPQTAGSSVTRGNPRVMPTHRELFDPLRGLRASL
jgi:hypothetical protein